MMKSICVLDVKNSEVALASFAQKLLTVLGGRMVLMSDDRPETRGLVEQLRDGLVQGGGTVFCMEGGFESRIVSASRLLEADGAIYLTCDSACRLSVYGANGSPLTNEEEQQIARATPASPTQTGVAVALSQTDAYLSLARRIGGSFENVAASFASPNASLLRFARQTALALGLIERNKPRFMISRSGLIAAAEDEQGNVYPHERLLTLCCACELADKQPLTVPFSASLTLTELARRNGVALQRSFAGGGEPWQTDGVLLVFRLLHHMSKSGRSLSSLFGSFAFPNEKRTVLSFGGSLDRLADRIPCEEAVTQTDDLLFIKRKNADAVLTRQKDGRRCCLEVQAFDAETARELCGELERAILTFSDK